MESNDPQTSQHSSSPARRIVLSAALLMLLGIGGWALLARVAPKQIAGPAAVVKKTSDNIYYAFNESDLKKAAEKLPPHVNILITGLDNRLGENDNHADAIHLCTIFPDEGTMLITSVPRDTKCFIDSLYPDSLSHFSNARSVCGRKGYITRLEQFLNKGKIDYWVEVNFSTAMGFLQLLGYHDPATALQFLRARKSFGLGDVQRSYNQAAFIKHEIVKYFNLMTGMSGDFLLTAGLGMLQTNLTKDVCEGLIYKLRQKGFPHGGGIELAMDPPVPEKKFAHITINPQDADTVVAHLMDHTYQDSYSGRPDAAAIIGARIEKAAMDSVKKPYEVVHLLGPIAEQHGWLQIADAARRDSLCSRIEQLLISAYMRMRKPEKAAALRTAIENERKLFRNRKELFSQRGAASQTDSIHANSK